MVMAVKAKVILMIRLQTLCRHPVLKILVKGMMLAALMKRVPAAAIVTAIAAKDRKAYLAKFLMRFLWTPASTN